MGIGEIILLAVLWIVICLLNFVVFIMLYDDVGLKDYIDKLSVRGRNILFRVFVILGPISLAIAFVFLIICILFYLLKEAYKWLIDIDNTELI